MTEKRLINKRRKARPRGWLTTRAIFMLILCSVMAWYAFTLYVGDDESCVGGTCESLYSLGAYALAFLIIIGSMVIAGAVVGTLIAYMRRGRHPSLSLLADKMAELQANAEQDGAYTEQAQDEDSSQPAASPTPMHKD